MSGTEGLFCEDEGYCICGNDCFNPGPYTCGMRIRENPAEYCDVEVRQQCQPCPAHEREIVEAR